MLLRPLEHRFILGNRHLVILKAPMDKVIFFYFKEIVTSQDLVLSILPFSIHLFIYYYFILFFNGLTKFGLQS